jgi:nucleoside-diphosphate-sugar epimerase
MEAEKTHSVLVTGARGFIGQAVCKLLQREGYRVAVLDQSRAGAEPGTVRGGEIQCDIADAARLQAVFAEGRIDAMVHLAAILPTAAQRDPVRATQVNILGSLNLFEMARRFGVRRMVFGSSLSIYGSCPPDERVRESHRTAPEDLYGAAKLYVEQMGEAYRSRDRLEFVALRIGRVVGEGAQSATSAWRSEIFERLKTTEVAEIAIPFVAHERILLVHVTDVARMLTLLVQAQRPQHVIYNAPCESVVVSELKSVVESLNPKVRVNLGTEEAVGNPRQLDFTRFEREFAFQTVPIFNQLKRAAEK